MKPFIRFGLIMGALLAAFPLLLFALGLDKEESIQSVSTVVNLLVIGGVLFFGIREERDIRGNGFITFGKGFGMGFKISVIAASISAISSYLYFSVINPGMFAFIKMKQEEAMIERGMSDEQVAKASESMAAWMTPGAMAGFSLVSMVLLGTVLTLIVAAFLKKEDPSAEIS
jgi:hypothetical protein